MKEKRIALIIMFIAVNLILGFATIVVMDENLASGSFFVTLWVSTIVGLIISDIVSIEY